MANRNPPARMIRGTGFTVANFTMVDDENVSFTMPADKSMIIYDAGSNFPSASVQMAQIGYGTTPVINGNYNSEFGIKLPKGQAPAIVALNSATFVWFYGELVD